MQTIKRIFELRLTEKEARKMKKVMAIVMTPILVFYMSSMNILVLGMMKAGAEDAAVAQETAKEEATKVEKKTKEETPKEEAKPVEEKTEDTKVAETPKTEEKTVETAKEEVVAPVEKAEDEVKVEESTKTEEPAAKEASWEVSGKTATITLVELGKTYKAPQNDKVTVTFTKLPEKPGSLTIKEIKLTSEEQLAIGALSDTAYDITSDMTNGTFEYNLTLPYPDRDNDGKAETNGTEIKADELRVMYTEKDDLKKDDLKNVEEDNNVDKNTKKGDKVIELKGLDHFTIFVVTNPNPAGNGSGSNDFCATATAGGVFQCYDTLTAAIAAAPADGVIIIKAGSYTDSPTINKDLTLELNGDVTFSGTLTVNSSSDTLILKQHEHTLTAAAIDNKGEIKNETGDGNLVLVASTGDITARDITSVGNVTLTATLGNIFDDPTGAQSTYITGTNITLSAPAGSIGTYNAAFTQVSHFNGAVDVALGGGTLNATALNDVAVTEVGSSSINSSNYNLTSATAGKYVIFGNMKASGNLTVNSALDGDSLIRLIAEGNVAVNTAISTSANTVSLYARGNITLSSSVTAADTVTVKSGFDSGSGSISDDLDQTTYIQANNISLTATSGNIGSVSNGAISTDFSGAVDVKLGTGSLTATAAGSNVYLTEVGRDSVGTSPGLGQYSMTGAATNLSVSKTFSGASTLTSPNGKLTISDSDSTGSILIAQYAGNPPAGALSGAVALGTTYYEIQTSGTINYPVDVQMSYVPGDIAGMTEDQINGIYYNDGSWKLYPVADTTVDRTANTILVHASHLTPIIGGGDITAPTVNITAPLSGNNVVATNVITFADNETTNPQCSVDNTNWTACTTNVTTLGNIPQFLALPNGAFTLYLKDTDLVGNIGTDSEAGILKNDIVAPTVTLTALVPDPNNDKTPTMTGNASDVSSNIASVEYEIDASGVWIPATASDGSFNSNNENYTFTTADLTDASHTIKVRATDAAGQTTALVDYASDTFTIDSTAPTFTMQYYSDSGLTTSMGDNPDLKVGTYYIKITSSETLVGTPTVSIDAEGTANDATDDATTSEGGNDYKYTRTIAYDSVAFGVTKENISVSGTDTTSNPATNVNPTNEAAKAAYTDTISPEITVDTKSTNHTTPFLTGTWSDSNGVASISITINGHTYSATVDYNGLHTWGVHVTDALVNGVYDVIAAATDYAGNIGNDTTTNEVSISNTAPILSEFSSTTDSGIYGIGDNINVTAEYDKTLDSGSHLVVTLNTGASVTLNNVSGSNISGTYTVVAPQSIADLTVTAITHEDVNDTFGNNRGDSAVPGDNIATSKDIVVDGIAPGVTVSTTSADPTNVSPIPVIITFTENVTGFDDSDITVTNGVKSGFTLDTANTVWTINITPSAQGAVTVQVPADRVNDVGGNGNTVSNILSVTYDTAAPSAPTISTPGSHVYVNADNYSIVGTAEANALVKIYKGADLVGSQQLAGGATAFSISVALTQNTDNIFTATATDAATNESLSATVSTITEDSENPLVNAGADELRRAAFVKSDSTATNSSPLTYAWTKFSGPGIVTFTNANDLHPTISADTDGVYVLLLTVTDAASNVSSDDFTLTWDTTPPVLSETTPVTNPTGDDTPNYVFNSTQAGNISYSGGCSSATTAAVVGANAITFNTLADGTYGSCKIIVTDPAGNPSAELSVSSFDVDTTAPSITVNSPNGGEYWQGGSVHAITWTATDSHMALTPITLAYSTDGILWTQIATGEDNDGTYSWNTVPAIDFGTVKIKVTAVDTLAHSGSDESNNNFTIDNTNPAVTVTSPNGAEFWSGGSTHNITWSTTETNKGTVAIDYSLDNGGNWSAIDVSGDANDDGTFSWTLPGANTVQALVRVTATDLSGRTGNDVSNATFTIDSTNPIVAVTSPNGAENWAGGSTQAITWTSTETNKDTVAISYTTDGSTWNPINLGGDTTDDGTFNWTVPSIDSNTVTVKVVATDKVGRTGEDVSDANFIIDSTKPTSDILTTGQLTSGEYTAQGNDINGTAADGGSGVASVDITIQNKKTGDADENKYWNGGGWQVGEAWLSTGDTTTWDYVFAPTDTFIYEIKSRATDGAGNIQDPLTSGSFTYDTTNPASTATIANATYGPNTWSAADTINGTASDATTGVAGVTITIQDTTASKYWDGDSWEDGVTNLAASGTTVWTYNLVSANLTDAHSYTVTPTATDGAGNSASGTADSFSYDSSVATPTLILDGGATYTTDTDVTVAIGNDVGVAKWYLSEADVAPAHDAGTWIDEPVNFILSGGDGTKTVYVFVKDAVDNVSASGSDGITLDGTKPTISRSVIKANSASVGGRIKDGDTYKVYAQIDDNLSGVNGKTTTVNGITLATTANLSNSGSFNIDGTTYNYSTNDLIANVAMGNGAVAYAVNASDNAGNNADVFNGSVTADNAVPTLSPVHIASNNATTTLAKVGDVVTLTFTSNENIQTPTVTIAGHAVAASQVGDAQHWTASYTMTDTDAEGVVPFNITFTDTAGNAGVAVTAVTDGSSVTFDRTVPTLGTVTIVSNNSTNTDYAKVGDVVTLTIVSSENLTAKPTVNIATHAIDPANVIQGIDAQHWIATYTMVSGDTEGTIPFTINFSDLAGNAGTQVTATIGGSSVTFDKTDPDEPDIRTDEGLWYDSRPTDLDIDFSDDRMLQKVEYKLNSGGTWRIIENNINDDSRTGNWALEDNDWSAMDQGDNYYLWFRVTDKAGNTYTTSNNTDGFWFRKDTGNPNAPTYNTAEDQTFTSNPTLDIDFSDSWTLNKIDYQLDGSGGSWINIANDVDGKTYTSNWSMTSGIWDGLGDGTHYIYFRISDDAGNVYTTGSNGAGFLFYKNSGSGGTIAGVENNGEGGEEVQGQETNGEEGQGVEGDQTFAPGEEAGNGALPYEIAVAILLAGSGIWWWLRRGGRGMGSGSGNSPMMFTLLKNAASKIRMFLW